MDRKDHGPGPPNHRDERKCQNNYKACQTRWQRDRPKKTAGKSAPPPYDSQIEAQFPNAGEHECHSFLPERGANEFAETPDISALPPAHQK